MTSLPIGASTPKTRENTTFLMAQGFKRCKTRVSEAPEWNSAAGAAHLWGAGKTAFWHLKVICFTMVSGTFAKGRWVQAPKELTLSVLKPLGEVFRQEAAQHAGRRCEHRGGFTGYRLCRRPIQHLTNRWLDGSVIVQ